MTRKQLTLLFLCDLLPYIVGNGIMALIPIYARRLGADEAAIGLYLAISFAVLTVGSLASGWLSSRFRTRKGFIVLAAVLSAPLVFLMGHAQDIVQLTVLTSLLWFMFGVGTSMVGILTGMYADPQRRGLTFGIIGASLALGRMIGGTVSGPIVDHWDYATLFAVFAGAYGLLTLVGLLLDDRRIQPDDAQISTPGPTSHRRPAASARPLLLLLSAHVLISSVVFVGAMARPIAMEAQGFSTTAISGAVAISGLVNLPLPFVMGWFSDHVGRRLALLLCYGLGALGIAIMIPASAVWHFWLGQVLLTVTGAGAMVGSALVTDLATPERLSASLARYASMGWLGAVVGFIITGFVMQHFGVAQAFAAGAALALTAGVLVLRTLPPRSPYATQLARRVRVSPSS